MVRRAKVPNSPRLFDLVADWMRELRAEAKSPNTSTSYRQSVMAFLGHLSDDGDSAHCEVHVTDVDRGMLVDYFVWLHETYADTSTMVHYIGLRRFFAFLVDYDEIPGGVNPMRWIKRPQPAIKPVEILTEDQIRRLLATVEKGKSLSEKRDHAIIRLFLATGMRLSELGNLQLEDIHLDEGYAYIRRGKGGNARTTAFGLQVTRALSQYIHVRGRSCFALLPDLWISKFGRLRTISIRNMLAARGEQADIEKLHAYLFRHFFAHSYLAQGGQENHLLQLAGWADSKMVQERYGASKRRERAINEHHKLRIGEDL